MLLLPPARQTGEK